MAILRVFITCFLVAFAAKQSIALTSKQVSLVNKTGHYFILDHNKPSTGPRAGFLSIEIKNISSSPLSNVEITINQIVGTGYSLGLNEDATRFFQEIPVGKSVMAAFFIRYPATFNTTGQFKCAISDNYSGFNWETSVTTPAFISASAGGLINKRTTSTAKPVGQIWTDTIRYHFGNMLIGDKLYFQPVSNASFDCKGMYLTETEVIYSEITGVNVGDKNVFCDTATGCNHGSNGAVIMVNKYIVRNEGVTISIVPVCATLSGNFYKYQDKYANTTTGIKSTTGKPALLKISKVVDNEFPNSGDTIHYHVLIENISTTTAYVREIHDILPDDYVFLELTEESDISTKNTRNAPKSGCTKHMPFESGSEEGYVIKPKGYLKLQYKVKTPEIHASYRIDTNKAYFSDGYYVSTTAYSVVRLNAQPLPIKAIKGKIVGNNLTWDVEGSSENAIFQINGIGNQEVNIANIPAQKGKKHYELPIHFSGNFDYYKIQVTENGVSLLSSLVLNTLKPIASFSTYPNPFNQEIQFNIPNAALPASLIVYNIQGQPVANYSNKSEFIGGIETDTWPSGMYFFHLKQADQVQIFKATKVGR